MTDGSPEEGHTVRQGPRVLRRLLEQLARPGIVPGTARRGGGLESELEPACAVGRIRSEHGEGLLVGEQRVVVRVHGERLPTGARRVAWAFDPRPSERRVHEVARQRRHGASSPSPYTRSSASPTRACSRTRVAGSRSP